MRPVLILCDPRHLQDVRARIAEFAHPQMVGKYVSALEVDQNQLMYSAQKKLLDWVQEARTATDGCQVVCTKEIDRFLGLKALSVPMQFELRVTSAVALLDRGNKGESLVKTLVNGSGLDVVSASTAIAQQWSHAQLNRAHIDHWLNQFVRLGRHGWLGKALLGQFTLASAASLGDTLRTMTVDPAAAICVSREPRGGFKSADVLGNLLHKRFDGRVIHPSPAAAIELHGQRDVVLFEDGLWSGTEAMGIVDSLLGKRDSRLKTARLATPELLKDIKFKFAYAVGTDYGQALLRRYLNDNGLDHVEIECSQLLQVADPRLLAQMSSPGFELASIRDAGPKASLIRPHAFAALRMQGMGDKDVLRAFRFSNSVGAQLFTNYVSSMQVKAGWSAWPAPKIERAAVGMHGLGLTHGFAHSIPKASLPLFWGEGKVVLNGAEINWSPLFPNS